MACQGGDCGLLIALIKKRQEKICFDSMPSLRSTVSTNNSIAEHHGTTERRRASFHQKSQFDLETSYYSIAPSSFR